MVTNIKVKEDAMTTTSELKPLLNRLRLGYLMNTLPERLALARREQLDYAAFLQIILADEVTRRDNRNLEMHLQRAGFEEICRLEDFDWTAQITVDRRLVDAVFSLDFINRHEHVIFVGPVGVGKSFLAQAVGYAAVRVGYSVRFTRADAFFRSLAQS
jgi:DNA replication protein DnaC